jgi:hypothetical protein
MMEAVLSPKRLQTFTGLHGVGGYRDIAAGIVTSYGMNGQGGVRVPVRARFFSSLRPDLLWGPLSLLSTGYRGLFPGGKAAG